MTPEDRAKVFTALQAMEKSLSEEKQQAYASSSGEVVDSLRNFKAQAQIEGREMTEVWLTFFLKQVLAVANAIQSDPKYPVESSEGMVSRILDIRVYAGLLACMLVENGAAAINEQELHFGKGGLEDSAVLTVG